MLKPLETIDSSIQEEKDTINQLRLKSGNNLIGNNYNNDCIDIDPFIDDCIMKGKELSNWFMQRVLNPGSMCN